MNPDDIRADAVTMCLRTNNDTLSVWQCRSTNEDIREVMLAIASTMDPIETMNVVLIKKTDLNANSIAFEGTPQETETPIKELSNRHFTLINLTAEQLCSLARQIATNVRQNIDIYRFTQKKLLTFMANAVEDGRLRLNQFYDNAARLKVEKKLKTKSRN